jgi:hypothetical protein
LDPARGGGSSLCVVDLAPDLPVAGAQEPLAVAIKAGAGERQVDEVDLGVVLAVEHAEARQIEAKGLAAGGARLLAVDHTTSPVRSAASRRPQRRRSRPAAPHPG